MVGLVRIEGAHSGVLPFGLSCPTSTCRSCADSVRSLQLLTKGANLRACSNRREGGTPLHEATAARHHHVINLLLEKGASPWVQNRHKETAYDLAIRLQQVQLVRWFERLAKFGACLIFSG
jgi:Ankyrin repeats (3 copies)